MALAKLEEVFPEKAKAIEKKMNINVTKICKEIGIKVDPKNPKFLEFASWYYYDVLGCCLNSLAKPGAVKDLNQRKFGFLSSTFEEERKKENLAIELLIKPLAVQNGFVACIFCKSKNTSSLVVQTRSGDEMATAFVDCAACGRNFVSHQ
ncbi:transcription factor S-II-domain-containing protein RNAP subunit [Marseillevirus marseillevirus]|uniref:Transcription factor S-II-domain-containing protein RNAP subunit n=1 Tax=Marseillevirus marseillevirus TaxID=694581 RepID=D2XAM3_GBMV|nr:transcription factor S-II-domain-containing protein RNAP subunit [Marseillevirus marseillevirus]ADB04000.1 transcription factor S-II-domain-containing protein RNAP subunit [Marseillevirus marseillevirus]